MIFYCMSLLVVGFMCGALAHSVMVDSEIQKYEIEDERFAMLREKLPVEITDIKVNKEKQTITFEGYEYEYTFHCIE